MGKKNPNLARMGDVVRIKTPRRFIRCGYDLTPELAADKLVEEHPETIANFLKSIGIDNHQYFEGGKPLHYNENKPYPKMVIKKDHRAMKRFLHGLGYLYGNAVGLGDGHRKLFFEPLDESRVFDETDGPLWWTVVNTMDVMTGKYYRPGGGYDSYNGEYYYEPGGLENQKSNRIVRLEPYMATLNHMRIYNDSLWMYSGDLEKISPEEVDEHQRAT